MRRLRSLAVAVLAGLALAGCGAADQVTDEIDAQTDRARDAIEDPAGAADEALQRELDERGIDGQAP